MSYGHPYTNTLPAAPEQALDLEQGILHHSATTSNDGSSSSPINGSQATQLSPRNYSSESVATAAQSVFMESPTASDTGTNTSLVSPMQTISQDSSSINEKALIQSLLSDKEKNEKATPMNDNEKAEILADATYETTGAATGGVVPVSFSNLKRKEKDDDNSDSSSEQPEGKDDLDKGQSTLAPFDHDSKEIRRLRRKIDRRLMPMLSIIYLCSYLDRANIGNSKVFDIERDLNVSNNTFTWALSIFYFAYILGEVPSSLLLKKVGPSLWISIVIFLWGAVMMSMSALKNGAGLLAARFFLGLFESGYAPAPVFLISVWYTRREQALRIGIFFSAATIAGACAGLLAYAIANLDGIFGLRAWSWIFLLEGGVTVVVAIISYFALPDLPETAKFLTEREKLLTTDRLRYDAGPATQTHFSWKQFRMVYNDPKTYMYMTIGLLHMPGFSSLGLFVPAIVHGFNFDPVMTQLMTVPIWAMACVATLFCSFSSDRLTERGYHGAVSVASAVVGYLLLIFIPEHHLVGRYLSLMLCACGVYACVPILLAWPTTNVGGHTKRAVTIATCISLSQVGSALGGKIYRDDDAPRYIRGHTLCAGILTLEFISILLLKWYLKRLNARRQAMSPEEYERACQGDELCDDHPDFRFIS